MSRCLLIGASGFLGKRLLNLGPGIEVVGAAYSHCAPGLRHLDLRDRAEVDRCLREVKPDIVVYAAGLTSVDACEHSPAAAHYLNAQAPDFIVNC